VALTNAKPKVVLQPITDADIAAVAAFLHTHLNADVPAERWATALTREWGSERPNAGFMLVEGEHVVGANIAFYSEREIDGQVEKICNLGAWCVLEEHRFHSLRLVKALLAQDGYHFTDLSPSGNVVAVNERLGFTFLDNTTTLVPNLPWPTVRARVSGDPALIERTLSGRDLEIYRHHVGLDAARHALLRVGDAHCHVIYRKDRRKGLPLFASILYVSDDAVFRAGAGALSRHLLLRERLPVTLVERAVVGHRPRLARTVDSPRRKMFRSSTLAPEHIDYLYSELVCLSW
jgi:hypothetical protein